MRTLIAATAAMAFCGAANAATIDAVDMLKSFTVIALGDYEVTSHAPASIFVGGDASSNGISINSAVENAPLDGENASLYVGGDITGGSFTVNGNVRVGGAVLPGAQVNLNGGALTQGADIPVAEVAAAMHGLSGRLSGMADAGNYTISGDSNNPRLNIGSAGADGFAVINISQADLDFFFGGNPGITFASTPITTVVNVAGDSFHLASGKNFDGSPGSNNVIFNFFEATDIVLDSGFGASILAPWADVAANTGGANVFLVGNNVTQKIEIRSPFDGDLPDPPSAVPLPATGWMLLAGLGALAALRRRRAA